LLSAGAPFTLTGDVIRLVLFDIDGTLIRTGGAGVEAFARAFAEVFGVRGGVERIRFAGRTDVSLVREMMRLSGVPETAPNFDRFFEAYVTHLRELMRGCRGEVCPGVVEFIAQLRALTPPPLIGLLTGNIRAGAEIKLRHFQLWDLFHVGAFADDHEDRNQIAVVARERGSRALREPLRGEQILVVGDTVHDIRCARAIGARVLAVATGGDSMAELQRHQPDWLVRDLREVSARELCGVAPARQPAA
jgi:phosphoglycolate phosphatase-like HAD superfamily hydrolase